MQQNLWTTAVVASSLAATLPAAAQCAQRLSGVGALGANRSQHPSIMQFIVLPGSVTEPERLVALGQFTEIAGVPAVNSAVWDGARWSSMGDNLINETYGFGGQVLLWRGQLLAAGGFRLGASQTPLTGVARWNGEVWQPFSSQNLGVAAAITEFEGDLIVGGRFSLPAGPHGVARWNGSSWVAVANDLAAWEPGSVGGLAVYRGILYAAGIASLAKLEDGAWTTVPVGSGRPIGYLSSLAVHNDFLYISDPGDFSTVRAWDGSSLTDLTPRGFQQFTVNSLSSIQGTLYAAGTFQRAPGERASGIATWNGQGWSVVAADPRSTFSGAGRAIVGFRGELTLGGSFSVYGPATTLGPPVRVADGIARVRCSCPADLDDGSGGGVLDDAVTIEDIVYYSDLFAAGSLRADLDDGSARGIPDRAVTIDDLLYFLSHFADGC